MCVVVYKYIFQLYNMVVMGLVLGQSLMVISTLLLCIYVFPLLFIVRFVIYTCEHMSAYWAINFMCL